MKKVIITVILSTFLLINAVSGEDNQFDRFGGWTGLKGTKTGVFHTEKINNRWWIITPEGNVFWSVGMYCVRISGIPETGTNKRNYKDNCIKKYGSEKEWVRISRKRLYDWGFNTIGDWSSESVYREPGLAYVNGIDLPIKTENVIPKGNYGYFPDVFSQEFKDSVMQTMKAKFSNQPYLIDDPWLLGYFLADEPAWYGSKQRRGALVDDFINLSSEKPGKIAWVEFLKGKYIKIDELNKSWQTHYKSFNDLLLKNKLENNENIEKDKLLFLKIIAEQFAKVLHNSLREFDKHHMILGTRPSRTYPELLEVIGKYSDIFSISAYYLNQGYSINPKLSEIIEEIYQYSNKPILLGVLISAQDTDLPYGMVKSQKDRGISYWRYLAKVTAHPNIIGMHWFQYFDPPRKCYDTQAANWGLVNEQDQPYDEAVNFISQANKMVYAYALGLSNFTPEFDNILVSSEVTKPQGHKATGVFSGKKIELSIANSGFEQRDSSWKLQSWKGKSKAYVDSAEKHSGRFSLKISGGPDEGWDSVGVGMQSSPEINLIPGHLYRLSAWIKTKNVEDSAFVRIKTKYKNGESIYFETPGAYGTNEWKIVETKFSPREENKVEYMAVQLVGKGIAWFDDISLTEVVNQ